VPATVFAAIGPRNGIEATPCPAYQSRLAAIAAGPQASIVVTGLPGSCTSQNASPPIPFMCG
jgi:hypothetical protein